MSASEMRLTEVPSVKVGMLIRRPPREVFEALTDPEITSRFWFTRSSGRLEPGAKVRWEWEMYAVSANVSVRDFDPDHRILMDWGDGEDSTTVEFRFVASGDGGTYVEVTETGLSGTGDELVARAAGSTGGFTIVLCAMKALLEHDVVLNAVADRFPRGID